MDLGILFGFLGTWVLIIWAILAGGSIVWFINTPGLILVCGGSVTIVFFAFPASIVKRFLKVAQKAFFNQPKSIEKLIQDMVRYAEVARRDGILSLENTTRDIDNEFIVRGIQMAVDGTDPELIEQIMNAELENLVERHTEGRGLFESLGRYSPAFGMIGTLVGLVIMLMNMDDPSKIGPGMAVAILTTMYGAVIANAFALPIADRLNRRSSEEVLYMTIIIKGVMAIQSGDNPRVVEQKLRTFLPSSAQASRDDQEAAA